MKSLPSIPRAKEQSTGMNLSATEAAAPALFWTAPAYESSATVDTTPTQTNGNPNFRRFTLKHVAEGELLEREMDWLAIQRLKAWGLLEQRGTRLKLELAML